MEPPTAVTATFLFTDIEGSSRLWDSEPHRMPAALAVHDQIVRKAVEARGGTVFKHTGDGVCAVFSATSDAVAAAVDAQRALHNEQWDLATPVLVRMGIHVGEAEHRDDDYYGVALNRVGRLHALAHGGQIVLSDAARAVLHVNVPPGIELVDLGEVELRGMTGRERIFQVNHPELPTSFPPLATTPQGNLPPPLDDMTGRDRELGQVVGLLGLGPLVTLTGFGGVGKSRVAVAAAAAAAAHFPDGVWWVELAPARPDTVDSAVAHTLSANRPGMTPLDAVIEQLRGRKALLVIDNCEHVLAAAAAVVETLLRSCPSLGILCTSRVPLGVGSERTLSLRPLGASEPGAGFDAVVASPSVELFERRARQVDAGFVIDTGNADTVAEICRRVDGLPLAIELAAARTRSMTPSDLLAHLHERFRLLRNRDRGLADVVAWSYDLLAPDERMLFEQLSVFRGRFSLDAVVAVAGPGVDDLDALDALDSLVEQSLVDVTAEEDATRYALLETLRDFGAAKLDEGATAGAVGDRHCRYFLAGAEASAAGLCGAAEAVWVRRVEESFADLRTAFEHARATGDVDTCVRLVVALEPYAFFRLRVELADWAVALVDLAAGHPQYQDLLGVGVRMSWARGDVEGAAALDALAPSTEDSDSWLLTDARGIVLMFRGDATGALACHQRGYELAVVTGDPYRLTMSQSRIAFAAFYAGGRDVLDVAAGASETAALSGNPTALATAAWTRGIASMRSDRRRAVDELRRARDVAESVGNLIVATTADDIGRQVQMSIERQSDVERLVDVVDQVERWGDFGRAGVQWGSVRRAARALVAIGRYDDAAVIGAAEEAARAKVPVHAAEASRHAAAMAHAREELGDDAFERLRAEGARLSQAELLARLRAAVDAVL